jgi:biopolymer transport protein ExbB
MELFEFIKNHLLHVAPILASAVFAGAVISERFRALFKTYSMANIEGFFSRIRESVSSGRTTDAMALCNEFRGKPQAELIRTALERAHQPEELIMNSIEMSRNRFADLIQKRTQYLAMIANVATLLGLLGTIAGLIESFSAVGRADPQQKAALLANGISTAMNATLLGLAVAVPCMVVFSVLISRSNRLVAELENAGILIMDAIQLATLRSVGSPVERSGE